MKNLTKKEVIEQIDHIIESEQAEYKLIQDMYEELVEQERVEIINAKIEVLKELIEKDLHYKLAKTATALAFEMIKELKEKIK